MGYIVGIDTGGTFTDGIVIDTKSLKRIKAKVLTTPYDLTECFAELLKTAAGKMRMEVSQFLVECESIRYSTTIVTNTVITRSGTRLGLLVTKGNEKNLYTSGTSPVFSFVEPSMVIGLGEKTGDGGEILKPLAKEESRQAIEALLDRGARSIAVALKNSQLNPTHELAVRETIRDEYPPQYIGRVPTFLSHEVADVGDDHIRLCSTIIDAYVHSKLASFLYKAEDFLRANSWEKPLLIVNSDGALSSIARTKAISTVGSGPAAGVIGAYRLAEELYRSSDILTLDIGGTSLDMGLIRQGRPKASYYFLLEGCRIFQPSINVSSVAIGGGSVVKAKEGKLTVGPDSVGSFPGPACFDTGGTEVTPTDANLLLGYLDPNNFMGGQIPLNPERAKELIDEKIARPLKVDVMQACRLMREATDSVMSGSITEFLDENKASKIQAFYYGGGGPLHACSIMSNISKINSAQIFSFSSEFSAMGCCLLELEHHSYSEFSKEKYARLDSMVKDFQERANRDLEAQGVASDQIKTDLSLYFDEGKSFIPIDRSNQFDIEKLDKLRGPFVISSRYSAPPRKLEFKEIERFGTNPIEASKGTRNVYWHPGEPEKTMIYSLDKLSPGISLKGPAIIESVDTTLVLEGGFTCTLDKFGNGCIERS